MKSLAQLFARLDYEFDDSSLLQSALTHRSAGSDHNERLEFLGDALLDLVISEWLYLAKGDANEGDLSRLRASLVRRDSLASIATSLELGDYLAMGPGELRTGGFRRNSILADTLEAVLGAIYLDGGYAAGRHVVLQLFNDRLESLPESAALRDPKSELQEWLQARGAERPEYRVETVTGMAHEQKFHVVCNVAAFQLSADGYGTSRRRAEQDAAREALNCISDEQPED